MAFETMSRSKSECTNKVECEGGYHQDGHHNCQIDASWVQGYDLKFSKSSSRLLKCKTFAEASHLKIHLEVLCLCMVIPLEAEL